MVWVWVVVVRECSGDGAGAAHCSGRVGTCVVSGNGADVAHRDESGVVVVAVI